MFKEKEREIDNWIFARNIVRYYFVLQPSRFFETKVTQIIYIIVFVDRYTIYIFNLIPIDK